MPPKEIRWCTSQMPGTGRVAILDGGRMTSQWKLYHKESEIDHSAHGEEVNGGQDDMMTRKDEEVDPGH